MKKPFTLQVQYDIVIPVFEWKQVGGDMSPGAHGGIIARADGTCIEITEIQPVRAYIGDGEAVEVGHPFWSKEGYFTVEDLDPNSDDVISALQCCGVDLQEVPSEHLAVCIAECLLMWGRGDEGSAGWSDDVVPAQVEWWGGVAGPEYLSDEDLEFAQLLAENHCDLCGKAADILSEYLAKSLESDIAAMCDDLEYIQLDCVDPCGECEECLKGNEAECTDAEGPTSIDVRLQLHPDGRWDIHSGDASYDTDHHGFWGASSVNHADTAESISETVRDLISQCLDMLCQ